MKFFNHLAVLGLVIAGILLSGCGKSPDETARELLAQKVAEGYGFVTLAAASTEAHQPEPHYRDDCRTVSDVHKNYAQNYPAYKLTDLNSKLYIGTLNAIPPASAIEVPDAVVLVDTVRSDTLFLLMFEEDCMRMYFSINRGLHERVPREMGEDT